MKNMSLFLLSQPWIFTGKGWTSAALLSPILSHCPLAFSPHNGQNHLLIPSACVIHIEVWDLPWYSRHLICSQEQIAFVFMCKVGPQSDTEKTIYPGLFPIPCKGKNNWKEWKGEGFPKMYISVRDWLVCCYWLMLLSIPNRNKSSNITQHWDLSMVFMKYKPPSLQNRINK